MFATYLFLALLGGAIVLALESFLRHSATTTKFGEPIDGRVNAWLSNDEEI